MMMISCEDHLAHDDDDDDDHDDHDDDDQDHDDHDSLSRRVHKVSVPSRGLISCNYGLICSLHKLPFNSAYFSLSRDKDTS